MILERSKDPMGRAIYDYSNKAHNNIIKVYSPEFFDDYIETSYLFRSYKDFPEIEKQAMQYASGRILDIGCGAGSHALYLKSKGARVEALDISPYIIGVMNAKGIKSHLTDILDFNPKEKYDTLLLLMNGLGIAGKRNRIHDFLNHLKSILTENGQIILESCSTDYLFDDPKEAEGFSGEILYQMEYKDIKGSPFYWLYLPFEDLELYAHECGLKAEKMFESESSAYLARLTKL